MPGPHELQAINDIALYHLDKQILDRLNKKPMPNLNVSDLDTSTLIYSGIVVGTPHAKPDLSLVHPLEEVHLVLEPENPVDPQAIKVMHPVAAKLGYVPKIHTHAIHQAIASNIEFGSWLYTVDPAKKWSELTILVAPLSGIVPKTPQDVPAV